MRKRGRAGALSWPVGPGTRLGLLGNPGAALSAFQQAPLLFPLLCSIHGPAPGPGRRAGKRAGHPLPQAQCPGTPAPASALLAVTGSPGRGCRTVIRPAGPQAVVAISGGRAGLLSGKDSRLFPSRLSSTALISFPARRDSSLVTQKKTPPKTHNPHDPPDGLEGGGLAAGSLGPPVCQCTLSLSYVMGPEGVGGTGRRDENHQKMVPPWRLSEISWPCQ